MKTFQSKVTAKFMAFYTMSLIVFSTPLLAGTLDLSGRRDEDNKQDSARKPAQIIDLIGIKKGLMLGLPTMEVKNDNE